MNLIFYSIVGLLGLVIGSFLNVVILRLHTKKISKGRSKCSHCGHTLNTADLFPVISYLFLKGRCRYCGVRISKQYITVELMTAAVFILMAIKFIPGGIVSFNFYSALQFFLYVFVFSVLIVLSLYDIRHFVLPWKVMKIFLIASFIIPILIGILGDGVSLANFISGFVVAFPFYLIWHFSKGKLIGFGDIELMCGIGFLLCVSSGFMAVMVGFWMATIYVFLKMLVSQKILHGKTQIPFGPFLALGLFVVFFMNYNLNDLVLNILK
jgi:leader peptidase (prepilin peptidase)/N-methyltransferase